jgi:crotonobetainyl-CoA:carnitine CoA-transferase CaiB-like acyl-CoA transferase
LQAARIPAFPSMNSKDLAEDPQLNERGFFARLPHPAVGTQTHAGIPWLLTNSPNGVRTAAPTLGQHTNEVLRELLHYSEDKIARLMRDGILT